MFWLVTGAAFGAGTTVWAERRLRRSVHEAAARLQPDALVAGLGRSARQATGAAAGRVREAVSSGRQEMQRREEELWADLAAQGVAGERTGTDRAGGPGGAPPKPPSHLGK